MALAVYVLGTSSLFTWHWELRGSAGIQSGSLRASAPSIKYVANAQP